ncbi:MAG: hypothetical protein K0S41_3444, partial [Anaerocolumna sp.]|nr:hypothetical protein [Anaerocolumna sp.]
MDAFGRIIAVILAVIMITLFPLQYIALNQNTIIDNHVHSETTEFIEEIMLQGYITMDMYNNFLYKLDDSKQLYDVEIIHSKPKQAVDINNINGPSINSKLMKTSFSYASEVKKVNENKANEKKDNEKKAEEQLRIHNLSLKNLSTSNNNIQLLATHTHSSNCYVTDEYVFETTSTCGHTLTQNATTT